jgi:hypothetical protein
VPESEIESGELLAVLATETLPLALLAAEGVKVAVSVTFWPGVRICPEETPLALNPAPEMVTLEMLTLELPALVSVTVCVPLLDRFTLPNPTEEALEFSSSVAAVTESVAALLVADPALLLTATVNFALLSVVVSAGVV